MVLFIIIFNIIFFYKKLCIIFLVKTIKTKRISGRGNLGFHVLFRKKNYKNPTGWGGRGNLGFPTL